MNGEQMNGEQMNGEQMNGEQMNGEQMNGEQMNGEQMNGEQMNGEQMNGGLGISKNRPVVKPVIIRFTVLLKGHLLQCSLILHSANVFSLQFCSNVVGVGVVCSVYTLCECKTLNWQPTSVISYMKLDTLVKDL
ncbi:hypothetical protein J6590_065673 [Homalodisca vitripennis]|nr:hypothetical protein J6590_065673 [Homalodisca vitripennis]